MTKEKTKTSNGTATEEEKLRQILLKKYESDKKNCHKEMLDVLKKFGCRIDIKVSQYFNSRNGQVAYKYEPIIEKNEA